MNDPFARLLHEWRYEDSRWKWNPREGYCCALVKLGKLADQHLGVYCTHRAKPGDIVCGKHDYLYPAAGLEGVEEYLDRHGWSMEYEFAPDGSFSSFCAWDRRYRDLGPKVTGS